IRVSISSNSSRSRTTRAPTSSRWLSMIRRASSARSSGTAMRTSPSGLIDIGRIACGLPVIRKPEMPWLSRSDSTTLASMSDVVENTTTGGMSGSTTKVTKHTKNIRLRVLRVFVVDENRHRQHKSQLRRHLVEFEQDEREVVVLAGVADKRADLAEDPLAQLLERQVAVLLDERGQPLLSERLPCRVHRLADAVGEQQHEVARGERQRDLLEQAVEPLAIVDLQSQHEADGRLDLDTSSDAPRPAHDSRIPRFDHLAPRHARSDPERRRGVRAPRARRGRGANPESRP